MDARSSTGFKGLPAEWRALLKTSQISKEEVQQNPQIVLDVLNFQMQGPPPVLPSAQTLKSAQEAASQFIKSDPNKVYKKIKKLGEGASGVVYSVIHRKTKEKWAVKITSAMDLDAIKTEISMQQVLVENKCVCVCVLCLRVCVRSCLFVCANVASSPIRVPACEPVSQSVTRLLLCSAREMQMSKHPNIVSYIETYLWEDNIWLIMECMDGGCVRCMCPQQLHSCATLWRCPVGVAL
jgi:serine/threonine protein kinase